MGFESMGFEVSLKFSGQRFRVEYHISGTEAEARTKADDICVEQTIEFPADLVTGGDIRKHILGRIETFEPLPGNPGRWKTVVSFAQEIAGKELTQLINVVFGNFSLKPGVKVEGLELNGGLARCFRGPRFGIPGLRKMLGVEEGPLFCTALKPMGLSSQALADLAYQFALGGVDMIKDDHGLADQPFAPYEERVNLCSEAVARAEKETGRRCLYLPNVTAPADRIMQKALHAKKCGVGGLLISPGITGMDTMRWLAEADDLNLPVVAHPAFLGTFTAHRENGLSHRLVFGQLPRLAGADATIYPNWGGRFSFTQQDCRDIVAGAIDPMNHYNPIFSMPGGGMSIDRIPEMLNTYGQDVIFLIGGALHRGPAGLTENCRNYMRAVGR